MSDNAKKNYIAYADIARILATFAVVVIHASGARMMRETIGSVNFIWASFFDCAMRWSVPLFVMLSGMLFLNKNKIIIVKTLYAKNIFRIVTAFVFWSYIYNVYSAFINTHDIFASLLTGLKNIPKGAIHLWFLFIIVGLYIVLPFVKRMIENMTKREAEGFMLLGLIVTFVPKTLSSFDVLQPFVEYINKFEINFAAGYVSLFVAGWYIAAFEHSKKFRVCAYIAGIVGFTYMFATTVGFSVARGAVVDEFMSFKSISAFFMAFAVLLFLKSAFAEKSFGEKFSTTLSVCSRNTFGVYLVHQLFLSIATGKGWFILPNVPCIGIIADALIVFSLSMVVTALIRLLPIGKYIS